MINPFDLIRCELGLLVKSLTGTDLKVTIRNAERLSMASKVFNQMIHSEPFFKALASTMEPDPFFYSKLEKHETQLLKHRFLDLRGIFRQDNKTYNGVPDGETWVSERGLEFISFKDRIIQSTKLGESSSFNALDKWSTPILDSRSAHFDARSDKYFVINNGTDRNVDVYTADRQEFLACYEIFGDICELTIEGNQLFVFERQLDGIFMLHAFNLERVQDAPVSIPLPGDYEQPACFGKNHIIYWVTDFDQDQPFALPLSCLNEPLGDNPIDLWLDGDPVKGLLYYFPYEDDFLEVYFKGDSFFLSKICIEEGCFIMTPITKNIDISTEDFTLTDVYLHHDRLFIAYEIQAKDTELACYDIPSGKMTKICIIPEYLWDIPFWPRFLVAAEKIYYLSVEVNLANSANAKSHLTMLTYGKI